MSEPPRTWIETLAGILLYVHDGMAALIFGGALICIAIATIDEIGDRLRKRKARSGRK